MALLLLAILPCQFVHAGNAHDLLGHDTDSMYLGMGGGDKGANILLLLRAYGLEAGLAHEESGARKLEGVDQLPGEDPLLKSTSFFVGVSPFTLGSWQGSKKEACEEKFMCMEIAYAQPYLHYKLSNVHTAGTSATEESIVLGARAYLGGSMPVRIGIYAQTELWGHADSSAVSGGVLFGTGNYYSQKKEDKSIPRVVGTVLSFAGLALVGAAIGLVFGFVERECSEPGKDCQSDPEY